MIPLFRTARVLSVAGSWLASYALWRSSRPVSFLNIFVLPRMRTVAFVSFPRIRNPSENTPQAINSTQYTHLQPARSAINPPIMGPRTGPKSGPRTYMDWARPRCSIGKRSAITPPPIERHADPPRPPRNRNAIREPKLGASAQPSCHAVRKALE